MPILFDPHPFPQANTKHLLSSMKNAMINLFNQVVLPCSWSEQRRIDILVWHILSSWPRPTVSYAFRWSIAISEGISSSSRGDRGCWSQCNGQTLYAVKRWLEKHLTYPWKIEELFPYIKQSLLFSLPVIRHGIGESSIEEADSSEKHDDSVAS